MRTGCRNELREHEMNKHKIKCEQCGKEFWFYDQLEKHMKMVHMTEFE